MKENNSNNNKVLFADVMIIFATVLIWRGFWTICDDFESFFKPGDLIFFRGILSVVLGVFLIWTILRLNLEKGFLISMK